MTIGMADRALDVDLLVRELGNWRTSSRSGPAYQGLADAMRMLIVDGRVPVGARLPSERALADPLRVSRTTVTAAYAQLREDGYLNARRGARSTTALPIAPARRPARAHGGRQPRRGRTGRPGGRGDGRLRRGGPRREPYLHEPGHELVGVGPAARRRSPKDIAPVAFPPRPTRSW